MNMKQKYKDILITLFKRFFSFRARKFLINFLALKKFDEVDMVFEFTRNTKVKKIMLDVGAHTGGSCEQFLDQSWRVYAFEPDKRNRRILELLEKKYPKLLIDTRAISQKDGEIVKFSKYSQDFFYEYLADMADISDLDEDSHLDFP